MIQRAFGSPSADASASRACFKLAEHGLGDCQGSGELGRPIETGPPGPEERVIVVSRIGHVFSVAQAVSLDR